MCLSYSCILVMQTYLCCFRIYSIITNIISKINISYIFYYLNLLVRRFLWISILSFTKFFTCCHFFKFFGGIPSAFYFSVSRKSVDQNAGKKVESHTFYPKHKKSPPHTGRRTSSAACQTGFTDARRGRISAFRRQYAEGTTPYRCQ